MIRQLLQNDNEQTMRFLKQDPEYNIFIIGDIEQFGYISEYQKLWGEFDDNELKSVLLQYRTNVVYYSPNKRSIDPFKEILESIDFDILNGRKEVIEVFEDYLSGWKVQDMYFASLTKFNKEEIEANDIQLLKSYDDFVEEYKMLNQVDEFNVGKRESIEEYAKHNSEIASEGNRTTYCLRVDNKMVSVATVVAENSVNGMIVGVATDRNYRKKGYASVVMNTLCDEYLNNKGKSLCLFFDNPKAGSIYHRLGFKDIGMYRMYTKND